MELEFLTPINSKLLEDIKRQSSQNLSNKLAFHTQDEFPNLEEVKIAIVGILEVRGGRNTHIEPNLDFFRKELYALFPGNWKHNIADLGDIAAGNTIEDTYFATQSIVSFLIKKNIIPIIIGGSHDLTYPLYRSYDNLEQMVNLVCIDSKFDLARTEINREEDSFLSRIIIDTPNNLFNYSNIGYQTYYNSQEEIDLLDKLYFDAFRLGEVMTDITITEPVMRDADFVSLDLNAVTSATKGTFQGNTPNGFNGIQVCSLSRYAGISDKVSLFGVFNQEFTNNEAVLLAQIVWYFIEGVNFRSNEYPFEGYTNYIKYIVTFDEDEELIFYKSNKTDRWWIEITTSSSKGEMYNKKMLLPCLHKDYLAACNNEYPDRFWNAQRKFII